MRRDGLCRRRLGRGRYLVVGGECDLRLNAAVVSEAWDVTNLTQWGTPDLFLGGEGDNLRFPE